MSKYKICDVIAYASGYSTHIWFITSVKTYDYEITLLDSTLTLSLHGFIHDINQNYVDNNKDIYLLEAPKPTAKYKAGDVIVNDQYIHTIDSLDITNEYYRTTIVGAFDNKTYNIGLKLPYLIEEIDKSPSIYLFSDLTTKSVTSIKHLCRCDKFDMINFGCKCGGV